MLTDHFPQLNTSIDIDIGSLVKAVSLLAVPFHSKIEV